MSLLTRLLNHIQRRMSSTTEVHGVKVANPGEAGQPGAAGKLLRLNDDGYFEVTPDFKIIGGLTVEGDLNVTGGGNTGQEGYLQVKADLAALDRITPRIKNHPIIIAEPGQIIFELPEPYIMGESTLLVWSGGVLVDDFTEISSREIEFSTPREGGERIKIVEFQVGSDDGSTISEVSPSIALMLSEIAIGVVDGTDGTDGNGIFTVARDVDPSTQPRIFVSGAFELPLSTWAYRGGRTFEIFSPYKPIVGEQVTIFYRPVIADPSS
jgi:hypothetical protein